jgi:hypothetical protein
VAGRTGSLPGAGSGGATADPAGSGWSVPCGGVGGSDSSADLGVPD